MVATPHARSPRPDGAHAGRPAAARWELYRVLAEPVRLRLLALASEEELAIGELADLLGESQPNVSRHAAPLRQAGLLAVRKEGTRTLVRVAEGAETDAVVADALANGRAICEEDGSLARVEAIVRAREEAAREFFARPSKHGAPLSLPPELGAYLSAFALLVPERSLAVDAGTGDGGLLDVLAPVYERVVAIDRSEAQLELARERAAARGYANVQLVQGDLDAPAFRDRVLHELVKDGADAVFASRLVHHAPKPAAFVADLARLVKPGGALVVIDYARHEDESMREHEADVWLGFDAAELKRFARAAGLEEARVASIPAPLNGRGPDRHLTWQVLVARKLAKHRDASRNPKKTEKRNERNGASHG